ncbi:VQ motif containing protein [Quillaja saponaria]|uniref:VQ motif containing protein n=1 Tax=Quillaja saponaria TaxID=32244 RepID=A0AAD7LRC7_QUISA|nr:VQ motif containing protein [Quillaja saponaria]
MASNTTSNESPTTYGSDPATPNTTFVQADPSNFRAVVQKLTGASEDPSTPKLPLTLPSRFTTAHNNSTSEMGLKRPTFKLHERRQTTKKLELSIIGLGEKPNGPYYRPRGGGGGGGVLGFGGEMVMASPVSPFELLARGSPRTPRSPREEEERAIAEKGFYLHPSPLSTPGGSDPPQLLPLFPLHSPRDN